MLSRLQVEPDRGLAICFLVRCGASSNEKKYSESFLELIEFLHALAEFLQFCNHSSNFFLYSLSGKTFRNETKKFLIQNCVFVKNLFKKNLQED